jgi:hypothetical protein
MMRGILADINVGKQRRAILAIWASEAWRDLWTALGLSVESFPSLNLPYNASDELIWATCQREGLVLITGNRNQRGSDSLEAAILRENQPDSLPVITIADPRRVLSDRLYAEQVAERLLEKLIAIDDLRGAGRVYVP